MSFLNPIFLFALIAVGLPLLIHLLNLKRPQKVAFSTLSFFRELKNTTIRRIRIKRYLLLFLRLAAIACLAMVLARPFLPPGFSQAGSAQAPTLNAILLDNSISMSRIGKKGPLFDYAKEIVRKIEESSKDEDRFMLQLTNGRSEQQNILSAANLLNALEELDVSHSGSFITARLSGLMEAVEGAPYQNKNIFVITDAQRSQLQSLKELEEEDISFTVFDVGNVEVQNTAVAGITASTNMISTNIPFTLNVNIANKSSVPAVNQFVTLQFEGEHAGQHSVALSANEEKTYSFEITPSKTGSSKGKIIVEGDEFQPDNEYYFTVQVPEARNILWIYEESPAREFISYTGAMLSVAGNNDAQLTYRQATADALAEGDLSRYHAILLDGVDEVPEYSFQALNDFVQNGGGLLFFPSEQGNLSNYNAFLNPFGIGTFAGIKGEYASFKSVATADELLDNHPAFSGMFEREQDEELRFTAPEVYYYLKLTGGAGGTGFNLLTLNNGDVLVREKRFGEGHVAVASIANDPGWSNFPVKALFSPFYYRLLVYAASADESGFANHTLGNPFVWKGNINADEAVIKVGSAEIKPTVDIISSGIQIRYPAEEWTPGWLTVTDGEKETIWAANFHPEESDFSKINPEVLQADLENAGIAWVDAAGIDEEHLNNEIMASGFGKEVWSWFMIAGLLFLAAESLISIFYKAETVQ